MKAPLKHIAFLFFMLAALIPARAQLLSVKTKDDPEKIFRSDLIKLQNTAQSFLMLRQYAKADSVANILLKRAVNSSARFYQAQAYLIKGKAFLEAGDKVQAYVNLLNASKLFYLIDDYEMLARTEIKKGVLYNRSGLWDKAYVSLTTADSLYKSIGFPLDRVELYSNLGKASFMLEKYDEALLYYGLCRKYAVIYQRWKEQLESGEMIAHIYELNGDYKNAVQYYLELVKISARIDKENMSKYLYQLGDAYFRDGRFLKAAETFKLLINGDNSAEKERVMSYLKLSEIALNENKVPDAVGYLNKAWTQTNEDNLKVEIINKLTEIFINQGDLKKASSYNSMALQMKKEISPENMLKTYDLAEHIAIAQKDYKKALKYSGKSRQISDSLVKVSAEERKNLEILNHKIDNYERMKRYEFVKENLERMQLEKQQLREEARRRELQLLRAQQKAGKAERENLKLRLQQVSNEADIYRQKLLLKEKESKIIAMQRRDAISKLIIASDSIRRQNHLRKLKAAETEKKLAELESQKLKRRTLYLTIILILVLFSLFVFLHSIKTVKKINIALKEKNEALETERAKLEEALKRLKDAQRQLIESERLASLGQISAGIAHEIRNPLNFVNNFALLSKQYARELEEVLNEVRIKSDNENNSEIKELISLLQENSNKIYEHGERAARIIKRMLESARQGHAVKEPTDFNLLIEDSAKLAYQGVRGDYPGFTARLDFDFDAGIGKVPVVAQDLGRVFINMVNNACHALLEKKNKTGDFDAYIKIKTQKTDAKVIVEITDNGAGMSEAVKGKLFTPFFTTKPAGKGTGLGLTMSYEIVKNVHGGDIKVESVKNEFTKFIIELPLT